MNLPIKIAQRYLFANSISGVLLVLALGYVFAPLVGMYYFLIGDAINNESWGYLAAYATVSALLIFLFLFLDIFKKIRSNRLTAILWIVGILVFGFFISGLVLLVFQFLRNRFKSVNAINIISGVSVFGISLGTAALVLVFSVFNGFEDLISGLFSTFNPDVKITIAKGKTFESDSTKIAQLNAIEGVAGVSETLEEVAFFEYKGSRDFGTLKGVDNNYAEVTQIESAVREGDLIFKANERDYAVMGVGMRNKLSVNVDNEFTPISVYMAKKKKSVTQPFTKRFLYPAGTFVIQQDFDNQYILCSIDFMRKLLKARNQVSAIEVSLNPAFDQEATLNEVKTIMGENFIVKNRYQQDEAFLKLMNIEKWLSYAILSLTMILVAFNLIGSLWMIVLDKKKDIAILKSMGATNKAVRSIFLNQGLLLCIVGMIFGFLIALLFYWLQTRYGVVPIPQGFVVDAYPIGIRFFDFVVVGITVVTIGLLASIIPAVKASNISALVREE